MPRTELEEATDDEYLNEFMNGMDKKRHLSKLRLERTVITFFRTLLFTACAALTSFEAYAYPYDPESTLETVLEKKVMTVGVAENSPWVVWEAGKEPDGAEVDLVKAFANALDVSVEWRRLDAFAALEGLERGDLHLAIGGFDKKAVSPVAGAAPSYTYFEEKLVIGTRSGEEPPVRLNGRKVYVPRDHLLEELVRKEDGAPVDEWTEGISLAALPHWQLVKYNLQATDIVLHRAQHVVAVRQGENAWLMRIEQFLRREVGDMGARLRANEQ